METTAENKLLEEKNLERRLAGHLPTLDIAGDIFYIDLRGDCLRPKNPLIPKGIPFSEIQNYFSWTEDKYVFTYNPTHHEPQEIDLSDLYHIPESIHLVEFPSIERLDPVGYAKANGGDIQFYVKQVGIQSHFKANVIPIKESLLQLFQHKKQQQQRQQLSTPEKRKRQRKGQSR